MAVALFVALSGCYASYAPSQNAKNAPAKTEAADSVQDHGDKKDAAKDEIKKDSTEKKKTEKKESEKKKEQKKEPKKEQKKEEKKEQKNKDITEDGSYYDLESVVKYYDMFGKLPGNYVTKNDAKSLGWEGGRVEDFIADAAIGGDHFGNYEKHLPSEKGIKYIECDIDTHGRQRGAKRLIISNEGKYYYTDDHYETFTEVLIENGEVKFGDRY